MDVVKVVSMETMKMLATNYYLLLELTTVVQMELLKVMVTTMVHWKAEQMGDLRAGLWDQVMVPLMVQMKVEKMAQTTMWEGVFR